LDAITQQEEHDLTNLMSEYDFAIKDAERFVDMLQQRLIDLDVVINIGRHRIALRETIDEFYSYLG
jgi:hypothetical protein